MSFYIVRNKYVGDHPETHFDADHIDIRTTPVRMNLDGEPKIRGWCGTVGGWCIHAFDEYPTLEAARSAVPEIFGEVRLCEYDEKGFLQDIEGVVETYKAGKYEPLDFTATINRIELEARKEVKAEHSDNELTSLCQKYECDANNDGYTLFNSLDFLKTIRTEQQKERI